MNTFHTNGETATKPPEYSGTPPRGPRVKTFVGGLQHLPIRYSLK
ncbi:hypothetical protein [Mycobacterium sp. SMC-2]|nr:hypothetical protein [Mycobacterium sp. SMC-2]